jgi:hypothetical protein
MSLDYPANQAIQRGQMNLVRLFGLATVNSFPTFHHSHSMQLFFFHPLLLVMSPCMLGPRACGAATARGSDAGSLASSSFLCAWRQEMVKT